MPIYLYMCEHCNHTDEKKMTMVEASEHKQVCEKCGKLMRRMYTPPGVQIH